MTEEVSKPPRERYPSVYFYFHIKQSDDTRRVPLERILPHNRQWSPTRHTADSFNELYSNSEFH